MDWIVQNIFQLIGVAGAVGTSVMAITKIYFKIENRVRFLEKEVKSLDNKIDKDLKEVHDILKELRNDIKLLLQKE
jgi:ribosomal protein S13